MYVKLKIKELNFYFVYHTLYYSLIKKKSMKKVFNLSWQMPISSEYGKIFMINVLFNCETFIVNFKVYLIIPKKKSSLIGFFCIVNLF